MNDLYTSSFNKIYERPPNFCEECGEMLDFNLIKNNCIICQKCGGRVMIDNILAHEVITTDYYSNSKEWISKLKNVQDKMLIRQELQRTTVFYFILYFR